MLLMVEDAIRVEMCNASCWCAKANKKNTWQIMIKIKNCHILTIGM